MRENLRRIQNSPSVEISEITAFFAAKKARWSSFRPGVPEENRA